MRLHRLLAVGLLVSPVVLAGQTDPVTIRVTPTAGQVLHSQMKIEMMMAVESDGDSQLPPALAKPMYTTMNRHRWSWRGTGC
jgi:hypothetical protein